MKTDYEILGVPEGASTEIIEKKYGALLRQYKHRVDENGATYEDLAYYEEITKAYDRLTGKSHDFSDDDPTSPIPLKVRRAWGKFAAFMDNYKLAFIILGLVVVFGIIFILQRNTEKEDIYIKFVGAFSVLNTDEFCDYLAEKSEVTENPVADFFVVTTETEYSQAKEAEATKFLAQYRAGYLDIIIIDKESFDVFLKDYSFMRLDDFVNEHSGEEAFSGLTFYEYVPDEDPESEDPYRQLEAGIYGIDISDCHFFDDSKLEWLHDEEKGQSRTMILTIASSTKRLETAENMAAELIRSIG